MFFGFDENERLLWARKWDTSQCHCKLRYIYISTLCNSMSEETATEELYSRKDNLIEFEKILKILFQYNHFYGH